MIVSKCFAEGAASQRVMELRKRVRKAMEVPLAEWRCPERIDPLFMAEPLAVRKARAIALKLSSMPDDLWEGQLLAGSMTLENPRIHAEWGFPGYLRPEEEALMQERQLSVRCFGHIVPDYPTLLAKGIEGICDDARAQKPNAQSDEEIAFLDSVLISLEAVGQYALRLADRCEKEASGQKDPVRAQELLTMAENLRKSPMRPAQDFWQALQSVWLLHMVLHSILNANALGRVDQYVWPYLERDLQAGRIDMEAATELVDCFCLKFNERAKATEEQRPEARTSEPLDLSQRSRHYTSSQVRSNRDGVDATNHWLQNIVVGGLKPDGSDGTNPLSLLLLNAYRGNRMTNPLLTVRLHRASPDELVEATCEVLKDGGGMPAIFNDEAIVPALEKIGIPAPDARDYTNDGCWEVIIPGRTDFGFLRISVMLCLEWALNGGRSRIDGSMAGIDTGDPRQFQSFDEVWQAFACQLEGMIERVVRRVVEHIDDRSRVAPVPILSALTDGPIPARRDLTEGGAKYRSFAMLAESAAHAIDSLTAIKTVIFGQRSATMAELCDALDRDFEGCETLRGALLAAPKYGNDDDRADAVGRRMVELFTSAVERHARRQDTRVKFPCGVGTFSWYIGIGEGLGPSADGRRAGEPVSSNFSPALGRDMQGLPGAILSYAKMHHSNLPAGLWICDCPAILCGARRARAAWRGCFAALWTAAGR